MKKILLICIVIIFILFVIAFNNSNPKNVIAKLNNLDVLQPKELRYRVYLFGVFPVGEALLTFEKIEDYNGEKLYHLNASAESLKILSKIFSGSVILDSYVNVNDLNPILFKEKLSVTGKESVEKEVFYDQKNNIMLSKGVERKIFPNTQDPLSAIFRIRRMDLNSIRDFELNLNTNQKNYLLQASVAQNEFFVRNKLFKTSCVKANIRRSDKNNRYHRSNMDIVFLKGKENIPILIKVFASGVLINVKLVEGE